MEETERISDLLGRILETQKDMLALLREARNYTESLVSVPQAASITGLSARTIRRYMADGKVRTRVKGGRRGIVESDLKRITKHKLLES